MLFFNPEPPEPPEPAEPILVLLFFNFMEALGLAIPADLSLAVLQRYVERRLGEELGS